MVLYLIYPLKIVIFHSFLYVYQRGTNNSTKLQALQPNRGRKSCENPDVQTTAGRSILIYIMDENGGFNHQVI